MLKYRKNLKHNARQLRLNMTDSERVLWSRLRRKQVLGVQFYRQKPIGRYIPDFYAPKAKLVVEVDGSQHLEGNHADKDIKRDEYLASVGLKVVRFNSRDVLKKTDDVLEMIYRVIRERMGFHQEQEEP